MKSEETKASAALEVKFKKIINHEGLKYSELSQRIASTFGLEKQKYYKLYYLHEEDQISVLNEEDYSTFMQIAQSLKLILEETTDQNEDFHQIQKKQGQEEVSKVQVSTPVEQKKPVKSLTQSDKDASTLVEQKKPVKGLTQSDKDQLKAEFSKKIQDKRLELRDQLQKFKVRLQQMTTKNMKQKLKDIEEDLRNKLKTEFEEQRKSRQGKFQHQIGCQSSLECDCKTSITGFRYQCIVCSIYTCESCSEKQFKTTTSEHLPDHPIVLHRSDKWDNAIIAELKKEN